MLRVIHLSAIALIFFWLLCAPFAWMLRDGLGPDAISSSGAQAFGRFLMTFQWGPVVAGLIFVSWITRNRGES